MNYHDGTDYGYTLPEPTLRIQRERIAELYAEREREDALSESGIRRALQGRRHA